MVSVNALETPTHFRSQGFEIGDYSLKNGLPVKIASGKRLQDFTPAVGERYNGPSQIPYLHTSQQLLATWYAQDNAGFDNGTVTFTVNWLWMEPSLFTVDIQDGRVLGWQQQKANLL